MKIKKPEFLADAEKKLKKIWDILRDKQVVRFKLSVKLYYDALSEPETISMQGERSADGGWNTWFPRDKNPDVLQSSEILKGKLASIEENVHRYIVENALDADWKELVASINEALRSGRSVEDLEYQSTVPIQALAGTSYEAHLCAPTMAKACVIEGIEALANDNLDHASHCVDRGLYWSSTAMLIPNPNDRFTGRASTGGRAKHLRLEPIKDKVAELLVKLAPEEGWETTTAAIEAVANELTVSHSRFVENCFLKTETLPRTILGWVKVAPERFTHRIKTKN